MDPEQQWQPLIDTSGDTEVFKKRYGEATQAQRDRVPDLRRGESQFDKFVSARRLVRMRARFARRSRRRCGSRSTACTCDMQIAAGTCRSPSRFPKSCARIRLRLPPVPGHHRCHHDAQRSVAFRAAGTQAGARRQDLAHSGRQIFHPAAFARDVGTPYDDIHWSAVLKSVSGFEMYRKKYGRIAPRDIVDFLVMDREFPALHSLLRQYAPMNRCTRSPARPWGRSMYLPSS